ncbi:MAG TPA: ABC transporter substrate-binding protein [Microvirga sp.]|jgi:iron complex transport system substrate-binding protein|nr:ABC transporter substrate-binding protein [Microvirga sp.]
MLFASVAAGAQAPAAPAVAGAQAPGRPGRVVSLNLCADQLLIALADREQVLSLSPLARDPSVAFHLERAASYPVNPGKGEAILFTGADLVFMGRWGAQATRTFLAGQGYRVVPLDVWTSLEAGRAQVRDVARLLGHPERGERLVAEIDAALARARAIVPPGRSVLPVQRRGWVQGPDSVLSEILRHMGFALHQERLGLAAGGAVRLEQLVTAPPDFAVLDEGAGEAADNGSAFLVHPALARAIPPERRLQVPGRLLICGGPSTPAAIDALAAEVRAKVR